MTIPRTIIISFCTVAAACGDASALVTSDDTTDTQGSPLARGTCDSTPGGQSVSTSNGPLTFTLTTFPDKDRGLSVTYRERIDSSFLLCHRFPNQPAVTLVFVVGPEHARQAVQLPMEVSCPRSYGDNGSAVNSASLSLREADDPALWNTLFPLLPDGTRWFAVQLALVNAAGAWDSRYGGNYALVLDRQ